MTTLKTTQVHLTAATFLILFCCSSAWTERVGRAERAIGGEQISRGRYPWLVLLRATIVTERLFSFPIRHYHLYCGGALVSSRWVITAAHCFTEDGSVSRNPHIWEARMAATRLRPTVGQRVLNVLGRVLDRDEMRQWEIDVESIFLHPQYNQSSLYSDDIALVKLSSSIPRGFDMIQSIDLPDENMETFPEEGQICITKGWGCTSNGGGPSDRARQIEMPIYPSWQCSYHYSLPNMDRRVCAGYRNAGIGVCRGDSGSPLVCQDGEDYKLVGVVSFTSRHRPESFPAVFTRVQDYLPWIRSVMDNNN